MNRLQEFLNWLEERYTIVPSDEYGQTFYPRTCDPETLYKDFMSEKDNTISKDIQDFMNQKIAIYFNDAEEYQICRRKMETMGYIIGNSRIFPLDSRGYDCDFPYYYVQAIISSTPDSNKYILDTKHNTYFLETLGMTVKEAKDLDFMIQLQKDIDNEYERD